MKPALPNQFRLVLLIIGLSLLGGLLIFYSTRWGPVADADTVEYFEAARNLIAGHGLTLRRASGADSPLSSRLAFYPIVLGTAGFLGLDLLDFARWLDIILFVVFILVLGLSTYFLCRQPMLSISICVLILASPTFLMNYSSAMSEPLFFTLGTSSLFLLMLYFHKDRRVILTIAAILAGLSFLSRYAGAAFVMTAIIGLMVYRQRPIKQRLLESAYFLIVSFSLLVPWLIGVYRGGDTPGLYYLPPESLWNSLEPVRGALVQAAWRWLPFRSILPTLPYHYKFLTLSVLGLILAALFLAEIRRRWGSDFRNWRENRYAQLIGIFSLFTASYLVILVLSYLFVQYPKPGLIDRILSPFQIGVFVAFFSMVYFLVDSHPSNKLVQLIPPIITFLIVISNYPLSRDLLLDLHENGRGFTSKEWRGSGLIEKVYDLPEEITLISNESEGVLFWTERPAYRIPEIWRRKRLEVYHSFGEDLDDEVQRIFRQEGAALLIFNSIYGQLWRIYEDNVQRRMAVFTEGLCKHSESWDGVLYFYECNSIQ